MITTNSERVISSVPSEWEAAEIAYPQQLMANAIRKAAGAAAEAAVPKQLADELVNGLVDQLLYPEDDDTPICQADEI